MNDYYVGLARSWTAAELAETITFEFVEGGEGAMTREDILLHLVNHATYHRGFVSTLLFPLKTKGAASDLTVFLRDVWLQFPNCDILNGDINGDGAVNGGDIDPFFECLGGGVCP